MDLKKDFRPLSSQTFLSMTQLWVCWTPRDPTLKQRMKKQWFYGLFLRQVAKFVSNVSRHRQAVVTLKIYIAGLDRLCATHFLTLLHPSLGFDPYFGNNWVRSTNQPLS